MRSGFEEALAAYIGEDNLLKIRGIKVGVAGAGGLGSNCACHLARSGFRRFKIVDFDFVEYANLNRQFYFAEQVGMPKVEALKNNLRRINPDIEIEAVCERMTEKNAGSFFEDCDILVEAFDKPEAKRMLVEAYSDSGKLIVAVSGISGWGRSDDIKVRQVRRNLYLIGDGVSEACEETPPMSPRVNIAAAKQADVVLEAVLGGRTGQGLGAISRRTCTKPGAEDVAQGDFERDGAFEG